MPFEKHRFVIIRDEETRKEICNIFGQSTVLNIFIDGKNISGNSDLKVRKQTFQSCLPELGQSSDDKALVNGNSMFGSMIIYKQNFKTADYFLIHPELGGTHDTDSEDLLP